MSLVLGLLFNSSTFLPHCRIFVSFSLSWLWSAALSFLCLSLSFCAFVRFCLSVSWMTLSHRGLLLACLPTLCYCFCSFSFFLSIAFRSIAFHWEACKSCCCWCASGATKISDRRADIKSENEKKKNSHRIWTTADAGAEFVLMGK